MTTCLIDSKNASMFSIITPFIVAISYVPFATCAIIASILTGRGDIAHVLGRMWAKFSLAVSGVKVEITGSENIPMDTPVIYASNHASQFDILALYRTLPVQFRFVVKKELFRIPLFGYAMKRAGYISIDRSGGKAAVRSLIKAGEAIRSGTSVVVFPEGTRSPDGRLRPIKPGAVVLAIKSGCPIVPVAISGSHRVLPKGRIRIRPGRIRVAIGPAIQTTEGGRPRSREQVSEELYRAIYSMLSPENRPEDPGAGVQDNN